MSLLRKLKEDNVRLPRFDNPDIYENVVITGVSDEKRKKKDGSTIPSLFFLKLAQMNTETGKKIREEDFAFWPTKHDKGGDNFSWYASNQATTLLEFLECYYPMEQLEKSFDPFGPLGLTEENYDRDVKKILGVKKNMDAFNQKLKDLFIAHVKQLIDNPRYNLPIRIKIVPSGDGKYLGLADHHWAESMTAVPKENSQLTITQKDRDLIQKWKAIKTGTPAVGGAAPMAPSSANPAGTNIPGANIPGANQGGIPGASQPGIPGVSTPGAQPNTEQAQPPNQGNPANGNGQNQNVPQPAQAPVTNQNDNTVPENSAPNPVSASMANAGQPIPGFPSGNGNDAGMPNPFNNGQNNPF